MDARKTISVCLIFVSLASAQLGPAIAGSSEAYKAAILAEIVSEATAETNGDAVATVKYDAPDYKEYDFHGKLGITSKAGDLKQVEANIAGTKSRRLHTTITAASINGNKATLTISRSGIIVLAGNGQTENVSYHATQKQMWSKASDGTWLETLAHGLTMNLKVIK